MFPVYALKKEGARLRANSNGRTTPFRHPQELPGKVRERSEHPGEHVRAYHNMYKLLIRQPNNDAPDTTQT